MENMYVKQMAVLSFAAQSVQASTSACGPFASMAGPRTYQSHDPAPIRIPLFDLLVARSSDVQRDGLLWHSHRA